jgi:hypothetical protein
MTTGITVLHIALEDAEQEEELLRWWDGLRELVVTRFRAVEAELAVLDRGHFWATIEFRLPGIWPLVMRDRRWAELEAWRPSGDVRVVQLRRWHRTGAPRDITTSELREIIANGDAILVDARGEDAYQEGHLPGAVRLDERDEAKVRAVLGSVRERPIVTYCSGYD